MADKAFDHAACIGCGACVAACKNASAMLLCRLKFTHLALLPQGSRKPGEESEKGRNWTLRAVNCSNQLECEAACPKEIPGKVSLSQS